MSNSILWLASWYPNALSPLEGDFIQRHARAAALLNNITVIFIKKDDKGIITKHTKTETTTTGGLTEIVIYYHPPTTGFRFINRLFSQIKYNRIFRQALKNHMALNGVPRLLHIHVALHVTRQALWLKKKFGIPIIVSEHWTGYLEEADPNLDDYHPLYKKWLQQLFKEAAAITTVSAFLGYAIKKRFKIPQPVVIHNVVDTTIFFPITKQPSPVTRFIHVSLLNEQKDPQSIIKAFSLVKKRGYSFSLTVYGPGRNDLLQLVKDNRLEREVIFKEEVPQTILANDMQHADALVLYSLYETFGCVVIEANACGIPAILSDLPVFREYIVENKTGIFARPADPRSLADALVHFISQKNSFSPEDIAQQTSEAFSFEAIAPQFDDLYKRIG